MVKLDSRVVLVTGAAGGLGSAMCAGLASAGHLVIAGVRGEVASPLESIAEVGIGRIHKIQCDVANEEMCRSALDEIVRKFGGVDVLVNNAAVGMDAVRVRAGNKSLKFYDLDETLWQQMMDVNVVGTFRLTRLVLRHQLDRRWGRIINVTTNLTTMQKEGYSPYGPSKAAIEAASVIWSKELQGTGITVNVLTPGGPANTRVISFEDFPDRTLLVQPEAMVPPLLWLISPAADAVTGRRYLAKLWRRDLPSSEAEALAGGVAGWS